MEVLLNFDATPSVFMAELFALCKALEAVDDLPVGKFSL
jgi:hypothetical protein